MAKKTQATMRHFYISLNYATFAISSVDGVVTHVAPIARWMKGRTLQQVKPWLIKKKAKVIEMNL